MKLKILFTALTLLFSPVTFGMDSISILPQGISSPGLKQGFITGAGQKYNSEGNLYNLSDLNSVLLDIQNLKAIEPDIRTLEIALNKFGQNDLGSTLHLGVLKVQTDPIINFSVPVFARGLSERWMVGIGVPIIHYSNTLSFLHTGSNIKRLKSQFYGISDSINDAFDRLDKDIISVAQQTLTEKGYKPIRDRDETFIGDIQLASFYSVYSDTLMGLRWQSLIMLPTGPQDDPSDLADLTTFGKTAWENSLLANFYLFPRLVLAVKGGFKWALPDQVQARVPSNSQDTLPGLNRTTAVNRDIGDSLNLGTSLTYTFENGWGLAAGLDGTWKQKDSYSGDLVGDYSLLSKNTESYAYGVAYEISYDTVSSYFAKKALLPAVLGLRLSDHFRGQNIERLTQAEFNATLFF